MRCRGCHTPSACTGPGWWRPRCRCRSGRGRASSAAGTSWAGSCHAHTAGTRPPSSCSGSLGYNGYIYISLHIIDTYHRYIYLACRPPAPDKWRTHPHLHLQIEREHLDKYENTFPLPLTHCSLSLLQLLHLRGSPQQQRDVQAEGDYQP